MFRGINALNLDAKGRLSLPAKYREKLQALCQGKLITTIDTEERCLLLYPAGEWEHIEEKVEALPSFEPVARRIQRLLIGYATETDMDNQGRLNLAPLLREYASIEKQVVLIGQGKKFEIWDAQSWQNRRDDWLMEDVLSSDALPDDLKTLSL